MGSRRTKASSSHSASWPGSEEVRRSPYVLHSFYCLILLEWFEDRWCSPGRLLETGAKGEGACAILARPLVRPRLWAGMRGLDRAKVDMEMGGELLP